MKLTRISAIIAVTVGLALLAWRATDDRAIDDISATGGGAPDDRAIDDISATGGGAPDDRAAVAPDISATGGGAPDDGAAVAPDIDDTDDSGRDQSDPIPTSTADIDLAPEPIPVLGPVDTLTSIDGWLNTDATSLEEILAASDVTLVQFWTFGCHNCKATLPHLQALYADYHDAGLEIVGVHAPEFAYEAEPDNVAAALVDLDVPWPVALDTTKQNFHRWQPGNTGYWPRVFVVDRDGQIRFDHIGEGKYDELRNTVSQLLTQA